MLGIFESLDHIRQYNGVNETTGHEVSKARTTHGTWCSVYWIFEIGRQRRPTLAGKPQRDGVEVEGRHSQMISSRMSYWPSVFRTRMSDEKCGGGPMQGDVDDSPK